MIGGTMNAIPITDLRALQSISQPFTYVDDCLVTSVREDIGWFQLCTYTSLAASVGIYCNPKKIVLRP